jgi:sterol desaturase/sphingolipid hydroxylase (fatty acid hydroxylase superfamily)
MPGDAMNFHDEIMTYELYLRIFFFLVVFVLVSCCEILFHRRKRTGPKKFRWINNLSLHFLNSLALMSIFPVLPIAIAVLCSEKRWGLFNQYDIQPWMAVLLGIAGLDLLIYLQHVLFHKVPLLWKLHRVHHLDLDMDITTGVRFHPIEIIMSALIKSAAVFIFGISVVAVLIFEILLNATSMFNHGNFRIPFNIDRRLRLLLVTPDMHRVHHSVIRNENNSNFGFSVSWWDFLFGTYTAQPSAGHDAMTIGLAGFLDTKYSKLWKMLASPFTRN